MNLKPPASYQNPLVWSPDVFLHYTDIAREG